MAGPTRPWGRGSESVSRSITTGSTPQACQPAGASILVPRPRQDGRCASGTKCKDPENADGKKVFALGDMDADHIVPWSKGGKTDAANGQMLCVSCNRSKGDL